MLGQGKGIIKKTKLELTSPSKEERPKLEPRILIEHPERAIMRPLGGRRMGPTDQSGFSQLRCAMRDRGRSRAKADRLRQQLDCRFARAEWQAVQEPPNVAPLW